jgi:hypothetical protein
VVVDVAEVPLVDFCQAGQLRDRAHQAGERVALRAERLAHPDEQPLHPVRKIAFSSSSIRSSNSARAKIEDYDDFVFIVAYGASSDGDRLVEVHCFYSERFLVTVHRDDFPAFAEIRRRYQRRETALEQPSLLLYRIVDGLVDSFFPVGKRVEPEDVAQDLEVARLRLGQVEPEEAAAGEQPLDRFAAEVHLPAAAVLDDLPGPRTAPCRRRARLARHVGLGARLERIPRHQALGARVRQRKTALLTIPSSRPRIALERTIGFVLYPRASRLHAIARTSGARPQSAISVSILLEPADGNRSDPVAEGGSARRRFVWRSRECVRNRLLRPAPQV